MSERIAVCIARAHPTLRRLWEAYAACTTDKQREGLVQVGNKMRTPNRGGRLDAVRLMITADCSQLIFPAWALLSLCCFRTWS